MIETSAEFEKATEELAYLKQWLARLQRDHGFGENAYTRAGVRKLIARLHEELAVYEGRRATRQPEPG